MIKYPMLCAGLDYSMTGPAITICPTEIFCFENCEIFFLTETKKYHQEFGNIIGSELPNWKTEQERFDSISEYFMKILFSYEYPIDRIKLYIEGYAMGAKGKVFNIAENTGIFKHKLYKNGIEFVIVAPTVIKKYATGKGNSTKDIMYQYFLEQTGVDLKTKLDYNKNTISSPIGDIVDSYYICKYGFEQEKRKKQ